MSETEVKTKPEPAGSDSHVPGSFQQILKLTRAQFQEYLASRRFVILLGIVAMIGLIITAVVGAFHDRAFLHALVSSPLAFYGSFWGGAASFVIVLSAVFFGGDAIAGEFQNKTGYFLMGLPIRRTTIYVGKYIAALLASICVLFVFFLIILANGVYYFGGDALPWQFGPSLLLSIIYLVAVLSTTFLFSSLFKTSAYGFVLTAILFIIGFSLLQDVVQSILDYQPWMVISYASSAIGGVFGTATDPCTGAVINTINWGLNGIYGIPGGPAARAGCPTTGGPREALLSGPTWTPGIAEAVVIMVGYFVITSIVGLLSFEREEFA